MGNGTVSHERMNYVNLNGRARHIACLIFALLLLQPPGAQSIAVAQDSAVPAPAPAQIQTSAQTSAQTTQTSAQTTQTSGFRLERVALAGGAELLTVFGSLDGLAHDENSTSSDVPLVSILRDTLGDATTENDRLRYVWMHTYTRPTVGQRAASAVPFLYTRVANKKSAGKGAPPHLLDLAGTKREVWHRVFLNALQTLVLNPYSLTVKATTHAYRRNADDYRKAHVVRALAVLTLYQAESGTGSVFAPHELKEIQARLMLTQKTFGGLIDDLYLGRVYDKQNAQWLDTRGHNWELLRQRAETEGLYFEPLDMPGGQTTHALLWIARSDVEAKRAQPYDKRFLNLSNPYGDKRLQRWRGYTETRYFDADNRPVAADTTGARAVELIPLALYGLDHPKIPILLVDFRDNLNPKRREMSQRVLQDVARTTASLTQLDLPFLLGRAVYDYVTERRGADINQPSRLRAYSQLKLLLALDASLDPELRDEVSRKLERVSLNPLENDTEAEARLAREQYAALLEHARRPNGGLADQLERDRRAELTPLVHTRAERVLLRVANVATFGLYRHREASAPDSQIATLDIARRLAHHRQFLREVARSSAAVEVQWNIADVRRALAFVNEHGERADGKTAAAVGHIFAHTKDEETQKLCLSSLYRINNETAKTTLVRIYRDEAADARWRTLSAGYLRKAARESQRISNGDARIIATISASEGQ
ncbi:MAG: hypothetical protein QOG71_128 [Pyrinomonadaceae bacterium]|nr:hypothetical protein [Pyrinomonadaceae bacterium]